MKPTPTRLFLAASLACSLAHAAPPCERPRRVVERFTAADCERCWSADAAAALPSSTWALDWIAPAGGDAALSAAALPDATSRLEALGVSALADGAQQREEVLATTPVRLQVQGGPAWNGYLGLELRSRGKPPAGAAAYLALVEVLPAGQEGSAVARRLLRAVAGPLVLDANGRASSQLRALRIPEGAKPERLQGVAWWVDAQARLRGIAREGCPAPAR